MKPVLFSNKARKDLSEIRRYTESAWSLQQSIYYRDMLLNECFSLPEKEAILSFPAYKDYHYTHCGHHYVFFKSADSDIKIVRILLESMNFSNHLT